MTPLTKTSFSQVTFLFFSLRTLTDQKNINTGSFVTATLSALTRVLYRAKENSQYNIKKYFDYYESWSNCDMKKC